MRHKIIFLTLSLLLVPVFSIWAQPSASVLNEGDWYKIAVVEDGIYRLDAGFFTSIGINPSSIDPRKIQIYGNGGGMLPQANDAPRYADLRQNAIWVTGENDGNFDPDDQVIFYGQGPDAWSWADESQLFYHRLHLYSDTNYYFLRIGTENGLRITEDTPPATTNYQVSRLRGTHYHEVDIENPLKSGRFWLGEKFDLITTRTYGFYVGDRANNGKVSVTVRLAARSDRGTSFQVAANGNFLGTVTLSSTNIAQKEAIYYQSKTLTFSVNPSYITDDSLRIRLQYNKSGSNRSEGWLDWIEVDYEKGLSTQNIDPWFGNLVEGVSPGAVAGISLKGQEGYRVWDITDPTRPREINYNRNNNDMNFRLVADSIKNLVAFRSNFKQVVEAEKIPNQNLHGLTLADYIVISPPAFLPAANKLADFHRRHYGRSAEVVTPQQIFNEFSSGKRDVTAIRDFIRMIWLRSSGMAPGFVCMLGDGSYDYKGLTKPGRTINFVPTYQSRNSWAPTASYVSDDFFVLMEEDEGYWGENSLIYGDTKYEVNTLDLAVGRLPVESLESAQEMVDKIIDYAESPEGLGNWRNRVSLVADHKEDEGSLHVSQADSYTSQINQFSPCTNVEKLYMDNYVMEKTGGKTRFPAGREALLKSLDEGALIVNYTGHGGEEAWSNSRILETVDIQNMDNEHRYPAVVTATCEFGRYDDHNRTSGAEVMTILPDRGAIALLTTVRLVYSSPNYNLNRYFYDEVFKWDQTKNRMPSIGEVMMRTKNSTFPRGNLANINSRNFSLLGDPGLLLNYPQYRARVLEINGNPVQSGVVDTLKSLSLVEVKGVIEDAGGNPVSLANGMLDVTVLDKANTFTTLQSNFVFKWQKNRIFNGLAEVDEGNFSFSFNVPIDISYEDGYGKISLYYSGEEIDGNGCWEELHIGGTDPDAPVDDEPPLVQLFINDEQWIEGGITGPNPFLYAQLFDESGINTVGSGIGHEISATLNGDDGQPIILNEYYTAKVNSYKEGTVNYQLRDLPEGQHTLRIRVWDVANNVAEAETRFRVVSDAQAALQNVLAYPNPFGNETTFRINHNMDGAPIEVRVSIYNNAGQRVRILSGQSEPGSNVFEEITWDATNEAGQKIEAGLYHFRVEITNLENGSTIAESQELVYIKS